MLGYRWLRQTQFIDQVATNAAVCLDNLLNNRNPGRMSQCLQHHCQPVLLIGKYLCLSKSHDLYNAILRLMFESQKKGKDSFAKAETILVLNIKKFLSVIVKN